MKKVILALSTMFLVSGIAVADTWKGRGSLYDQDRNLLSSYDLAVEKTINGNQTNTIVTITFAGGGTKLIKCVSRGDDQSWSKTCDDGKSGGGYYFDNGLVSEYVQNEDGIAYATTIIFDSDSAMRILRTELHGQDATRFFVETLAKEASSK